MINVVILGLGPRGGDVYGTFALNHPDKYTIKAICDANPEKLEKYKEKFRMRDEQCYRTSDELFSKGKLGDVLFCCTQDKDHYGHAMKALDVGYNLLLEKPIATSASQCIEIAEKAKKENRTVIVCHVLRYTPYFNTIKNLIDEGNVGEIRAIEHTENVGLWHYCHSYVRGNWRNTDISSEMILAKCSHDFDIFNWLLGKRCEKVYSTGGLNFFKKKNAPEGASDRCLSCKYKDTCPYSAKKIYLDRFVNLEGDKDLWPYNVVVPKPTTESMIKALETGNYGRCVFHSDNNVVDHQTVNMVYEGNVNVTHTMTAFSQKCYRKTYIHGTKGDIEASDLGNVIILNKYGVPDEITVPLYGTNNPHAGHNGGDDGLMNYLSEVMEGEITDSKNASFIENSIHSHIIAMASEKSRLEGKPVLIKDFEKTCKNH